mgnify:FL=1
MPIFENIILPLYWKQRTNIYMEPKKDITNLEQLFRTDLHNYLLSIDKVDERLPEAPDIEELWQKIGESYLPDGMREFNAYPTVSLGWMMFIGMAIAKYWDTDWELYSKVGDLYKYLRDQRDFDHMDDYICESVLLLTAEEHTLTTKIVGECASRTYNLLYHQHLEPGTPDAFQGYVSALHQMYLMGMSMELKRLGYHMTKLN